MRSRLSRLGLALLGVVTAFAIFTLTTRAEDGAPEVKNVAGLKEIMNAVNHKGHGLYGMIMQDLRQDAIDADGWKLIQSRAAMMAEAANLLIAKDPPKGDLASWYEQIVAYRKEATRLFKKAILQDLAGAREALEVLKQRCETCHDLHQSE
ncbi:MAG: hypothetical protein ACYTG6_04605 [Planctomycetota bacterium]